MHQGSRQPLRLEYPIRLRIVTPVLARTGKLVRKKRLHHVKKRKN